MLAFFLSSFLAHLPICVLACYFACLLAYLFACLLAYLRTCLRTCFLTLHPTTFDGNSATDVCMYVCGMVVGSDKSRSQPATRRRWEVCCSSVEEEGGRLSLSLSLSVPSCFLLYLLPYDTCLPQRRRDERQVTSAIALATLERQRCVLKHYHLPYLVQILSSLYSSWCCEM